MSDVKQKPWFRGAIWIGVGVLAWIVPAALGSPLVLRGTELPWGAAVIAMGALIAVWEVVKARRKK